MSGIFEVSEILFSKPNLSKAGAESMFNRAKLTWTVFFLIATDVSGQAVGSPSAGVSALPAILQIILANEDPAITLITHYYVSILRRSPEPAGLAYWVDQVNRAQAAGDGKPAFRQMASDFFNSAEYTGRNTTDREFLTNLYLTFFQREPDAGGLQFWFNHLSNGVPRTEILRSFLYCPEFTNFMESLGF